MARWPQPFRVTGLGLALLLVFAMPARGQDSLILGLVLEPPHLDPTAGTAAAIDEVVYANVFEGLTRIGPHGSVRPALAQRWSVSTNGRAYTFHLRQGVRFHDGTAFTAADVKYSLDRARGEGSANAQKRLFAPIDRVEVIDDATVRLHLARPAGDLPFTLGLGDAVIVAPESAAKNKQRPIGTGPFRFARWRRGDAIMLERFQGYWGRAAPLQRAIFKIIPDNNAAFAAVKAGVVHAFANFPAPETLGLLERDSDLRVVRGATEGETILALNNGHPALSDIRVRRALAHAVDKRAVIKGALFGNGTPIGTHFPPYHRAALDLADFYPHDPGRARALLAQAGYAVGLRLRLALPPPAYARRGGEIVAAQLRAVGVDVEIQAMEWAQWLERVFANKDYDMTIVAHTEPRDIGIYARPDYYFNYADPSFNALIDRLERSPDPADRTRLLHKAQRKLAEDAVNVFLFQLPKLGVWDRRLRGLWHDSPVQANDLSEVRWAEDPA